MCYMRDGITIKEKIDDIRSAITEILDILNSEET